MDNFSLFDQMTTDSETVTTLFDGNAIDVVKMEYLAAEVPSDDLAM